jgi:peptide/nickel transport system substrate-binding protein
VTDQKTLINESNIWKWIFRIRPFSFIVIFLVLIGGAFFLVNSYIYDLKPESKSTIIEGVVKSKDFDGTLSVNPLTGSTETIDKYLTDIIYEPLFLTYPDKNPEGYLAESFLYSNNGKTLTIKLKANIKWQDGKDLTSEDVIETLRRLKNIGELNNAGSDVLQKADITTNDPLTVVITTPKVISNLLELINVKVLPKHILESAIANKFSAHPITKTPLGTGPFKFVSSSDTKVVLEANPNYWKGKVQLKKYIFNLYDTEQEAIIGLKAGQIHIFNDLTTGTDSKLNTNKNITIVKSSPVYNRYFAIYFNYSNEILKNQSIRRAISLGVNKEVIIDRIGRLGVIADSTIPLVSWVQPKLIDSKYNVEKATSLVTNSKIDLTEKSLRLTYLNDETKQKIAESLRDDLKLIGISTILEPKSLDELQNQVLPSRDFDILLFGVETTSDPDRIRFWHEDAIDFPGLNFSSYVTNVKSRGTLSDNKTSRVNEVLEKGLSTLDKNLRKGYYQDLVSILEAESPATILYHPIIESAVNKRVENFALDNINVPEDRYYNMYKWSFKKD